MSRKNITNLLFVLPILFWIILTLFFIVRMIVGVQPEVALAAEPVKQEVQTKIEYELTVYYDIPLSKEIQDYTRNVCKQYDVPFELALALMEHESGFNEDAISSTNDYGIMQINKCNHHYLKKSLGFNDIMNVENNIQSGVFIISGLYHKYDCNINKALMAYNCGETGAKRLWNKGIYSTEYSRGVVKLFEAYNRPVQNG